MAPSDMTPEDAAGVTVDEMSVADVQSAHAYRHGERLMVVIGDEVFALAKDVAAGLLDDMRAQLEEMHATRLDAEE